MLTVFMVLEGRLGRYWYCDLVRPVLLKRWHATLKRWFLEASRSEFYDSLNEWLHGSEYVDTVISVMSLFSQQQHTQLTARLSDHMMSILVGCRFTFAWIFHGFTVETFTVVSAEAKIYNMLQERVFIQFIVWVRIHSKVTPVPRWWRCLSWRWNTRL